MNIHGPLYTFLVEHNIIFSIITMFQVRKGSIACELKIFTVSFFIFGVASLPAGQKDPSEVAEEHKHYSVASEPKKYLDGVSFFSSLCRKPLFSFIFIYLFK